MNAVSPTSRIILFLVLCTLTVLSVLCIDRYDNTGSQLLLNANFSEGLDHWQLREPSSGEILAQDNQLILKSHDAEESVLVYQKVHTVLRKQKLRLGATLATKDIISGENKWDKARLLLVQYIKQDAQWGLNNSLAVLEGSNGWQSYYKVFSLSPQHTEIEVIAQMSRCSGEFFIKDLSLYKVAETTLYTLVKWPMRAAWILYVIMLFFPVLKEGSPSISKIFIFLTVVGIVIGTTMPGGIKNELKEDITQELTTYSAPVKKAAEEGPNTVQDYLFTLDITKIAHFCLFAVLAFLLCIHTPPRPTPLILLELLMFASATELIQFFADDRLPLFTDIFIDLAGSAAGILAARLAGRFTSAH